jgi:hypothetical protein
MYNEIGLKAEIFAGLVRKEGLILGQKWGRFCLDGFKAPLILG